MRGDIDIATREVVASRIGTNGHQRPIAREEEGARGTPPAAIARRDPAAVVLVAAHHSHLGGGDASSSSREEAGSGYHHRRKDRRPPHPARARKQIGGTRWGRKGVLCRLHPRCHTGIQRPALVAARKWRGWRREPGRQRLGFLPCRPREATWGSVIFYPNFVWTVLREHGLIG